jgi:hypothetical protein
MAVRSPNSDLDFLAFGFSSFLSSLPFLSSESFSGPDDCPRFFESEFFSEEILRIPSSPSSPLSSLLSLKGEDGRCLWREVGRARDLAKLPESIPGFRDLEDFRNRSFPLLRSKKDSEDSDFLIFFGEEFRGESSVDPEAEDNSELFPKYPPLDFGLRLEGSAELSEIRIGVCK